MHIRLFGSFAILDAAGRSALPKGAKTRALVALLATSQDLSRPRAWIQDLLWSTRGPDQKAASLRQCLAELRRAWADYPGAIQADRQGIWLDPACIDVIKDNTGILLEDISVRDPAFIAWLGLQRLQSAQPLEPAPNALPAQAQDGKFAKRRIAVTLKPTTGSDAMDVTAVLHDTLVHMFNETGTIAIVRPKALEQHPPDRLLTLHVAPQGDNTVQASAVLEAPRDARVLWTGYRDITVNQCDLRANAALMGFCNQVLQTACDPDTILPFSPTPDAVPAGLDFAGKVSFAVSQIFSIRSDRVQLAVSILEDLAAQAPLPILFAWLAQAYTIQYVERYRPADAELRERCEEACREALAVGLHNSYVLAAVANARTNISRNYLAGVELAEQSVKTNPANPLAWWAHSNALQCIGRSEQAHRAALNAQMLADGTHLQFWSDFQVSVTAALLGNADHAIANGERSAALAPEFRPPLRYLTALYALEGDAESVGRTVASLKSAELDFSIAQMIEDTDYPIGMMRRYGKDLTRALRDIASDQGLD